MLLGITGTDGSGKGTVVDYLVKEKSFTHYSARAMFIEELERQGRSTTRDDLRLMGNELREKHGNDQLITHYFKRFQESGAANAVIESLRATAEVETLRAKGGILLAVDAGQQLRYERIQERKLSSDQISFEKFVEQEAIEMNDPDPHGMQKAKVMQMADYTIQNNGTLEALHTQIEEVLTKINHGHNS